MKIPDSIDGLLDDLEGAIRRIKSAAPHSPHHEDHLGDVSDSAVALGTEYFNRAMLDGVNCTDRTKIIHTLERARDAIPANTRSPQINAHRANICRIIGECLGLPKELLEIEDDEDDDEE